MSPADVIRRAATAAGITPAQLGRRAVPRIMGGATLTTARRHAFVAAGIPLDAWPDAVPAAAPAPAPDATPAPRPGRLARIVVLCDAHSPHHDGRAVRAALGVVEVVCPEVVVLLGDMIDADAVSRHSETDRGPRHPSDVAASCIDEYARCTPMLDEIEASCRAAAVRRTVYVEGNHEDFVRRWLDRLPLDPAQYLPRHALGVDRRGWEWVDFYADRRLVIGDALFVHGHRSGIYATRQTLLDYGTSVVHGHTHALGVIAAPGASGVRYGAAAGCLRDLALASRRYTRARPDAHQHGCAIVTMRDDRVVAIEPVPIVDGRAYAWGVEIDGRRAA